MIIRKMTIEDYDSVYKLWLNTSGMGLNDIDDSKEGVSRYLKRNPNTSFVAIDNNQTIGAIISGHDGRRGVIYHTAVAENMQRIGIGSKLLEASMNALKNEGISKVFLVVFENNLKGNSFWQKQGFEKREDLAYRNKEITTLQKINT